MPIVQLTQDETILRTVHKHPFSFFGDLLAIVIFLIMPVIFAIVLIFVPKDFTDKFFTGDTNVGILFIAATWLLFAWMFAWWRWTDHFLDVMIITNERIFEVKQNGFFNREVASFGIDRIQNIKLSQVGVVASMLNYGDIFIETAGEADNLDIKMVPNPSELKKFINELQDQTKSQQL